MDILTFLCAILQYIVLILVQYNKNIMQYILINILNLYVLSIENICKADIIVYVRYSK